MVLLKFASGCLVGFWFLVFGVSFVSAQPPPSFGNITAYDFESKSFFPAPNLNQVKSVIRGGQGQPLTNNLVALSKGVEIEMFRTNGQRELKLQASECLYDSKARIATSPGTMHAESGNGKYTIAGEGFYWRQADKSFFITNRVHSTVDTAGLKEKSARTNQTSESRLDIFSDRFDFDGKAGVATYDGDLRVMGTNLLLTASALKIKLPEQTNGVETLSAEGGVVFDYEQIHATGQRALYTTASNLVQLFGNPQWRAGQREGRGDEISVDRTNRVLRAIGNAYLKIPASGGGTFLTGQATARTNAPANTNKFLEIVSDSYKIQTNRAVFNGNVRATEIVRTTNAAAFLPVSKLACDMLIVELSASNEVQRVVAELGIVIEQRDKRFTGDSAVYTATNGLLVLRGSPTWHAGLREGKGDELRVDALAEQMHVKGNAWAKFPANEITAAMPETNSVAKTKPQSGTNTFAEIFSDEYTFSTNRAEFLRNVRVEHPQLKMSCENMKAKFSRREEDKEIIADQKVLMDVVDATGQKIHGTGDKAVYSYAVTPTATNDLLVLTGSPKLETERLVWFAEILTLNRRTGKIVGPKARIVPKEIPKSNLPAPKAK